MSPAPSASPPPPGATARSFRDSPWWRRGRRVAGAAVRGFHAYANWLVGISWRRFILLSVLLMIAAGILQDLPPFNWSWTRTVSSVPALPNVVVKLPDLRPLPKAEPKANHSDKGDPPAEKASGPSAPEDGVQIIIDGRGVRITPHSPAKGASTAPTAPPVTPTPPATPSVPSPGTGAQAEPSEPAASGDSVRITVPQGIAAEVIREAMREASGTLREVLQEAQQDLREAQRDVLEAQREAEREVRNARLEAEREIRDARREAEAALAEATAARAEVEAARIAAESAHSDSREALREAARESRRQARELARSVAEQLREQGMVIETRESSLGEALPPAALLWIIASLIIKVTYRRQIQAEAQAAQAVETAEAESLRRQVLEARVAAMQAQVEPHFLFNTLASIDHLIEVDPARASQMQKNLIALLRASMPTMRETHSDGGARDLGRELAVIRPYLEILKVRMDDRLSVDLDVPEGLESAEFPSMMVQTLVENAIKHGLEPKPEGGHLQVKAEIVHGDLQICVADSGLGFGRAGTAGTGVGLANIRERLQLLYGSRGSLTIAENPGGGTRVTIRVPYRPVGGASA